MTLSRNSTEHFLSLLHYDDPTSSVSFIVREVSKKTLHAETVFLMKTTKDGNKTCLHASRKYIFEFQPSVTMWVIHDDAILNVL